MSAVVFLDGRAIAPINPPAVEEECLAPVRAYAEERGDSVHEGWFRTGVRHGWISGWYAGFAAAQGMSASGQDRGTGLEAKPASPVANGDAPQ